jgi:hypothetical protein
LSGGRYFIRFNQFVACGQDGDRGARNDRNDCPAHFGQQSYFARTQAHTTAQYHVACAHGGAAPQNVATNPYSGIANNDLAERTFVMMFYFMAWKFIAFDIGPHDLGTFDHHHGVRTRREGRPGHDPRGSAGHDARRRHGAGDDFLKDRQVCFAATQIVGNDGIPVDD